MREAQAEQRLTDAQLIERVDAALGDFLHTQIAPSLREAIHYSVFSGGKRVRPILCLRACQAVGGGIEKALPAAGAIELIHTFSLVHDDLPAMDDDDLRRGRPTLHKHTNEAMAILAGDAMTVLAFRLLSASVNDPAVLAPLVDRLAESTHAMIVGQVYDTMGDLPKDLSPMQRLQMIHEHKTGALIHAAVWMGAVSGGAGEDQLRALGAYAYALGLMFQAVDDLLDVTQSTEKMGKATGKDAQAGKLTYPGLLGVEGTRDEIEKLRKQAIEALSGFDEQADPLRELAERLARRDR